MQAAFRVSGESCEVCDNFMRSTHPPVGSTVNTDGWFLPVDETVASRAVFVIVSGSDGLADGLTGGRTGGNAFGASSITQKRQEIDQMCQWRANKNPWAGY